MDLRDDFVHPFFPISGEIPVGSRIYTSLGPELMVVIDQRCMRNRKLACANNIAVFAVKVPDIMMSLSCPCDVYHP